MPNIMLFDMEPIVKKRFPLFLYSLCEFKKRKEKEIFYSADDQENIILTTPSVFLEILQQAFLEFSDSLRLSPLL